MRDFLELLGAMLLGIIFFILVIIFVVFPFSNNCYNGQKIFEYEDLDGNIGTAYNCQYSDASQYARKGGQGQPICFVGNKRIAVKWYEDKTEYKNCFKNLMGKE